MPMGRLAETIVSATRLTQKYAEDLLRGVEPHMFARKPTWGLGGKEIDCNHGAWIYGHLALYPPILVAGMGGAGGVGGAGKTGTPAVPGNFDALFKNGTRALDDPSGTLYPPMETIVRAFVDGHRAAIASLERMSDADLTRANTGPSAERFPTVGARANFLLNNHVMSHLGQFSTWRRCMGLGSAL